MFLHLLILPFGKMTQINTELHWIISVMGLILQRAGEEHMIVFKLRGFDIYLLIFKGLHEYSFSAHLNIL